MNKMFQKSMAI